MSAPSLPSPLSVPSLSLPSVQAAIVRGPERYTMASAALSAIGGDGVAGYAIESP